eukprot:scaffold14700_cov101-Isochrysis_galbana.AAC.2
MPIARTTPSSPLAPQSKGRHAMPKRNMGGSMFTRYDQMDARRPRASLKPVGSSSSRRRCSGTHGATTTGPSQARKHGTTISTISDSASPCVTCDSHALGSASQSEMGQRVASAPTDSRRSDSGISTPVFKWLPRQEVAAGPAGGAIAQRPSHQCIRIAHLQYFTGPRFYFLMAA